MAVHSDSRQAVPLATSQEMTDNVWFHRAPDSQAVDNNLSLVVLCTWLAAQRKHIAKYVDQWRARYPKADILVIQTSLGDMFGDRTKSAGIKAAREVLLSHIEQGGSRVLIHAFSNGGAHAATQLMLSLPRQSHTFKAVILDSCPGEASYAQSADAMMLLLPKNLIIRILGIALIHAMLCVIFVSDHLLRVENVVTRCRKLLNNANAISVQTPMLYIYSKADQLVPFEAVQRHIAESRQHGYTVKELEFESSGHCAHAAAHFDEYWTEVGNMAGK